MHFDDVLKIVGEFGRYQQIRFFLLCMYAVVSAWHSFNMVFVGAVPDHHCDISNFANVSMLRNNTPEELKSLLIPEDESCRMYRVEDTINMLHDLQANTSQGRRYNRSLQECTSGMYFSKERYKSTIASEFEMICGKKYWRSTSKSVYFFGRLCGAVFFGQVSDRFGRRPTFIVCIALLLLAGCVSAAAPNILVFLPMYFLQGAAQTGAFLVAFTQATEIVGPRYRVMVGFMIHMFYTFGYISLAGIAYLLRDWRHLEIAITVPTIVFILYWWFLPESIRWLLSQNREEEAEKILREVARVNKTTLPDDITERLGHSDDTEDDRKYSLVDLVRGWNMAKLSLNVWFNWLVNALVYYGLSLNTENLGGDPYLNFCISGAVEIPSYVVCIVLLNKVGRRWPLIATMTIGGIACISSGCIPAEGNRDLTVLSVVLAMVGKICITASYAIIYLMGAEVFPTVVRNIGMGMSSMSARIGGILAPQILELRYISVSLPLVVFGVMSILAGALAFLLPETLNRRLPQRISEVATSRKVRCCGGMEKVDDDDDVTVTVQTTFQT